MNYNDKAVGSNNATQLEVCTADMASIQAAWLGGAKRIELCTALALGGLTPQRHIALQAREMFGDALRIHVLLRPRPGDFLYSSAEIDDMARAIEHDWRGLADALVIGALDANGDIDRKAMKRLASLREEGCSLTFHRAFDMTRSPFDALEEIIDLGFDRVLTSGCAPSAQEGIETLAKLNEQAAGRISIMAGGGVSAANAALLLETTGIGELHASCSSTTHSRMKFRNDNAKMGDKTMDEFSWTATNENKVKSLLEAIAEFDLHKAKVSL